MTTLLNLHQLQQKYPSSLGYFLRYDFKEGQPHYPNRNQGELEEKLHLLQEDSQKASSDGQEFLQRRILETQLLIEQCKMTESGKLSKRFRQYNEALYSIPEKVMFLQLRNHVKRYIHGMPSHFEELQRDNPYLLNNLELIKQETASLVKEVKNALHEESGDIVLAARKVLQRGADHLQEWSVEADDTRRSTTVAPIGKKILIGSSSLNASQKGRKIGILTHEMVHVQRSVGGEKITSFEQAAFEEGLAHLIETIARGRRPYPARYWRYLAIGFATGMDGEKEKTAEEVYDILLPLYQNVSGRPEAAVEKYIKGTVRRVWQGSPLTVAGAVLYRDLKYAAGSFLVWEYLSAQPRSKEEIHRLLHHKVYTRELE